jgi:hypothetical protein
MESYTPHLPRRVFTFFTVDGDGTLVSFNPENSQHSLFRPTGHIGRLKEYDAMSDERIQYVVVGGLQDRYVAEKARYPEEVRTYDAIARDARLVYEITGSVRDSNFRGGPPIRIYEME